MPIELEIKWDGNAPGLQEHRLSVSAFGQPLNLLLAAVRRIATNIVRNAVGESEEQLSTGRFANSAKRIDIEIAGINEGSTSLATVMSFNSQPGETFPLFDLAERSAVELLEALEQESRGVMRNSAVRNYLAALPSGVKQQKYYLHRNGDAIRTVEIGEVNIAEMEEMPFLREVVGEIVGVGFEPGRNEVRVKPESGATISMLATGQQVESAIAGRGYTVRALAVVDPRTRLLRLERNSEARRTVTAADVDKYVFQRWDGLLRKLAR
jgi:hypothetical protein